jgi:hypothetical protein
VITEQQLRELAPDFPWDKPIMLHLTDLDYVYWACRYCIAMHGLKAGEISDSHNRPTFVFLYKESAQEHIDGQHAH